jgi:hypothetical protein
MEKRRRGYEKKTRKGSKSFAVEFPWDFTP